LIYVKIDLFFIAFGVSSCIIKNKFDVNMVYY
jgi:hypothetical protein